MENLPLFDPDLKARIRKSGVIAVLVIDRAEDAVPLARTLLAEGLDCLEITLRTTCALDALRAIKAEVPEMIAGVGTVLDPAQVGEVARAGADFGVAPGLSPRVVKAAQVEKLSFAPGVATPSEIEQAIELGCRLLKLFPAEPLGGISYLKSAAAPYAHLDVGFMPLGGLNAQNMKSYLESPLVVGLGGSWIAARSLVQNRNWAAIRANAREAVAIAASLGDSR